MRTGLRVEAALDTGTYDTGVKVTDAQIDASPMNRHRFHRDWNYILRPAHSRPARAVTTMTQETHRPRHRAGSTPLRSAIRS